VRGFCLAGLGESSYHGVCHGNIEEIERAKEERRAAFNCTEIGRPVELRSKIIRTRPEVFGKKGEPRKENHLTLRPTQIERTQICRSKEIIQPDIKGSFRRSGS
jgi:hypothetical protein